MRRNLVSRLMAGLCTVILSAGVVHASEKKALGDRIYTKFQEEVGEELEREDLDHSYVREAQFQLHLDALFQREPYSLDQDLRRNELYARTSKRLVEKAGPGALLVAMPWLGNQLTKLENYKDQKLDEHVSVEGGGWKLSGDVLCGSGILGMRLKKSFANNSQLRMETCGAEMYATYPIPWRPSRGQFGHIMRNSRFELFAGYDEGARVGVFFSLNGNQLFRRSQYRFFAE